MRAIITCTTCIKENDIITKILEEINWIPCKSPNKENDLTNKENDVINKQNKEDDITNKEDDITNKEDDITNKEDDITNKQDDITNKEDFTTMVEKKKKDILKNIPGESKEIIDATTICTIYNGETKTWGIVTRPNKFLISFRLKNPLSTRLKAACRSLILSLRNYKGFFALDEKKDLKHDEVASLRLKLSNFNLFSKRSKKERFKFSSIIEILEPGSEQSSFHGKIIQGSAFKATKEERKTEVSVVTCTFIFTVLLLYITSPLSVIKFSTLGDWGIWLDGNLQRVSTAAIVTMLVSIINLSFHWMSIRKEYPIRWIAEDVSE